MMTEEGSLARKIRKARELTLREWGWLFEAYAVLTATKLQLMIAPLGIVKRAVAREDVASDAIVTANIDDRMVRSFAIATSVHFLRPNCLPRSLSLWRMLRRRRIDAVVRIGARMNGGQLGGHAWVEVDGRVVNDREDVATEFTPLRLGGRAVEEWLKNAEPD